MIGGTTPKHDTISFLFRQPFPASYQRVLDALPNEAYIVHMALRMTLLPRSRYADGFTGLQQLLLVHILTHQPFDIVDFILAEIEDVVADGLGSVRQLVYAHWISYILIMSIAESMGFHDVLYHEDTPRFKVYRPIVP